MYWGMAASFPLFSPEVGRREPLVLGVLRCCWRLSRWQTDARRGAGFWAAVVLTTSIGPYLFTRFLIPDILVGLWLTLGFDFSCAP